MKFLVATDAHEGGVYYPDTAEIFFSSNRRTGKNGQQVSDVISSLSRRPFVSESLRMLLMDLSLFLFLLTNSLDGTLGRGFIDTFCAWIRSRLRFRMSLLGTISSNCLGHHSLVLNFISNKVS